MSSVFRGSLCGRTQAIVVLFVLGFVFVNAIRPGQHIPSFAGPYRVVLGRVGNTSEDYPSSTGKMWVRLRTTQVRGRQPQYGWGQAYISLPVRNDVKIEMRLASRSNNQWKKNAFVVHLDQGCASARTHVQSVLKLIYGKELESCPAPVIGLREIKNHSFEFVFPKFPMMPYGWYLFTFAVIRDKTVLGVAEGDCHILPRV